MDPNRNYLEPQRPYPRYPYPCDSRSRSLNLVPTTEVEEENDSLTSSTQA